MNLNMKKVWLAEFVGTFSLVFFGCGSMIAVEKGIVTSSYSAWVFGSTVFLMIVFFEKISNAHFNPAVSVGFLFKKRFPRSNFLFTGVLKPAELFLPLSISLRPQQL